MRFDRCNSIHERFDIGLKTESMYKLLIKNSFVWQWTLYNFVQSISVVALRPCTTKFTRGYYHVIQQLDTFVTRINDPYIVFLPEVNLIRPGLTFIKILTLSQRSTHFIGSQISTVMIRNLKTWPINLYVILQRLIIRSWCIMHCNVYEPPVNR